MASDDKDLTRDAWSIGKRDVVSEGDYHHQEMTGRRVAYL
jgi:hypothetical protein